MLVLIKFFSVWCETCSYQCLENCFLVVVVVVLVVVVVVVVLVLVVPLGHKWPSVILLDCVSKKYWVLLPLIFSDISCFSWPYKSGPSIALCFAWQLRCFTSLSSQFLIFLLIILYTVFLNIPLSSVNPNIKYF